MIADTRSKKIYYSMLSKLSHSALDTFRTCPRKYKFAYIEKPSVPRRLYAFNHLGNAVHRQLKITYQWAAESRVYPLEEMLRGFEVEWEGPVRRKVVPSSENTTVDDDIAAGRQMLERFYRKYQPFNQGTTLLTERKLDFDLPGCPTGFTARIDRLWKDTRGVAEICDYKTSKNLPAGPRDPAFRLQMAMYQFAVQEAFPQFTEIVLAQYFLRHDEVIRYQMRPDEVDELREQFRNEALEIYRSDRLDDWPTKEGGHCRFCDYARLCPAQRHRYVLEEESDSEAAARYRDVSELADKYLSLDAESKRLDKEMTVLKEEVKAAAKDLGVNKLRGSSGQITVSFRPEEKLPAKTRDPEAYVRLVSLIRSWDEATREICLKPDDKILLDLFHKNRLTTEQQESLSALITRVEQATVRCKPDRPIEADDEDQGDE